MSINAMGVGGVRLRLFQRYEDVQSNVFSVTRGWVKLRHCGW